MILNSGPKMFILSAGFVLIAACKPTGEANTKASPVFEPTVPTVAASPTAVNDPDVINFRGFGPAKFGGNEESVRMSWGRSLNATKPAAGSSCVYLNPETMPDVKRGIGFMFEEAKFVRYDVDDAGQIAPGNFKVGDAAATIKTAFAGRVEEAPHKYLPQGFTLTVTPEDKSDARLIFEIGEDGKVSTWRIGVPPQVYYVEGCS